MAVPTTATIRMSFRHHEAFRRGGKSDMSNGPNDNNNNNKVWNDTEWLLVLSSTKARRKEEARPSEPFRLVLCVTFPLLPSRKPHTHTTTTGGDAGPSSTYR